MDYPKKKLLTQSVAFLQANLQINSELLQAFKTDGVLTTEEISTIQVCQIAEFITCYNSMVIIVSLILKSRYICSR